MIVPKENSSQINIYLNPGLEDLDLFANLENLDFNEQLSEPTKKKICSMKEQSDQLSQDEKDFGRDDQSMILQSESISCFRRM